MLSVLMTIIALALFPAPVCSRHMCIVIIETIDMHS